MYFLEPLPVESNILSFSLLERFYASQQPQLTLPYKMNKMDKLAQTDAYVKSLPSLSFTPLPPLYEEIDLSSPTKINFDHSSPPPSYKNAESSPAPSSPTIEYKNEDAIVTKEI